ncbi:hypothetical protein J2S75_002822 [Ancylobacter polymorphus]|uniref:Uncharacterized protein n=1 Tax=Ancylobacter polymorphus TaxID=223390 RepID=A0ABU0BES3_9HYPH|nr:hypothetical protein [Ancylobacter polymorphus]
MLIPASKYDQISIGNLSAGASIPPAVNEVRPPESANGRCVLIAPEADKVQASPHLIAHQS